MIEYLFPRGTNVYDALAWLRQRWGVTHPTLYKVGHGRLCAHRDVVTP